MFVKIINDVDEVLLLAKCYMESSPDCAWFVKAFDGFQDFLIDEFVLSRGQNDPRMLGLLAVRASRSDLMEMAQNGGDRFAMVQMLLQATKKGFSREVMPLAQDQEELMFQAALGMERDAYAYFGLVRKDVKLLRFVGQLWHPDAMCELALNDEWYIPLTERMDFLCRASVKSYECEKKLMELLPETRSSFLFVDPPLDFALGCALKKHGYNVLAGRPAFGGKYPFASVIFFYENQLVCAKLAVQTWTLVAKRLGVVKDLRRLIGEMVWEARVEAKYQQPLEVSPEAPVTFMQFQDSL